MRSETDTMNCPRAENLLPLFVEGDLTAARVRDPLARHLRACAACARRADEYRESQNQLRLYAPPQFSEDFFQAIRQAVLSEIENKSVRPRVVPFPLSLRRRGATPALAASLALLLTAGTLALHFLWRRTPMQYAPPPVANLNSPTSHPALTPPHDNLSAPQNHADARRPPTPALSGSQVTIMRRPSMLRARRPPRAALAPEQGAQARLTSVLPATFRETPADEGVEAAPGAATEPPLLRMEIQTGDPGIRIIWFAPRATE